MSLSKLVNSSLSLLTYFCLHVVLPSSSSDIINATNYCFADSSPPAGMLVEQEIGMWEAAVLLWSLGHIGLERKKKGGGIGLAGKCKPNPASKVCPDESLSLALGSIQPF